MRALNIAATGLSVQQLNIDVISNNVANLSTTGFKQQRATFQDLIYDTQRRVGTSSSVAETIIPTGLQLGLGVNTGSTNRVTSQGPLANTGNSFDVAIQGEGYFIVRLPDGTETYTRDGTFGLNGNGDLVTQDGYEISPAITIPPQSIDVTINSEGQVIVTEDDTLQAIEVGQLDIAIFVNEAGLQAIGGNLFAETESSGPPLLGFAGDQSYGNIQQGFLEQSNVDSVLEITQLVSAQRNYELCSRIVTTADEMLQTLNQI